MKIPNNVFDKVPKLISDLTKPFDDFQKDIVLLSIISCISALLPKVKGNYNGDVYYSNLYFLLIAPPASGKGVMNYSKELVKPIHKYVMNLGKAKKANEKKKKNAKKPITKEVQPKKMVKLIPGNITSAELYLLINNSHNGGIIFESEADTLSVMLKSDFGNFSDLLRKAFHHEDLSSSRKMDDFHVEIESPILSIVLSGTENQIMPLIQSKENGLYSRFMYYNFSPTSSWRNVKPFKKNKKTPFIEVGNQKLLPMYKFLSALPHEIQFELSGVQLADFNKYMSTQFDKYSISYGDIFESVLKRHGLIFHRIAMVLSIIRDMESIKVNYSDKVTCNDDDFNSAKLIVDSLLANAAKIFQVMSKDNITITENDILGDLKSEFTTRDFIKLCVKNDLSERTAKYKLNAFRDKQIIEKIKHGKYKKVRD